MIIGDLTSLNEKELEVIETIKPLLDSENVDDILTHNDIEEIVIIPNVSLATVIINKHKEHILLTSEKWHVVYNISYNSHEELDTFGLFPYFGYSEKYSDFLRINDIC